MSARLRVARPGDLPALVAIKESLALTRDGGSASRGGFLLGCPPERYSMLIAVAQVTLLEVGGRPAGFAIALPDPVLRASELWARRESIRWAPGQGEPPEDAVLAYFDQLALAAWASRLHAAPLALAAVRRLAAGGHDHLYATTLAAPLRNRASFPLLAAFGAHIVGEVEEVYPEVGAVQSLLHHASIPDGLARIEARSAGARTAAAAERMAA
ncbi:MAG TPA: hypothetical protein VIT45_06405 [Allosphingosinicella sp.]